MAGECAIILVCKGDLPLPREMATRKVGNFSA